MRPRLIHPRSVLLYRRKEATDSDPDLGPKTRAEFEAPVKMSGQVRYNKWNAMTPTGGGNDPVCDGHIAFLREDWLREGGKVGDEMELVPDDSRLIVIEVRPAAHYAGQAWHAHVMFTRRRATR